MGTHGLDCWWARPTMLLTIIVCCLFTWSVPASRPPLSALSRERRNVIFPSGGIMQLSLGIAVDGSSEYVLLHTNVGFQQNVPLPTNITQLREEPPVARAARKRFPKKSLLYGALEREIERYGFHGEQCLLKSICEIESSTFSNRGIFEDILENFLRPGADSNWDWDADDAADNAKYLRAREVGSGDKAGGYTTAAQHSCQTYFPLCPLSPFALIAPASQLP